MKPSAKNGIHTNGGESMEGQNKQGQKRGRPMKTWNKAIEAIL